MGKLFSFLSLIATVAIGMYIYSQQVKSISPSAATSPAGIDAANITGVKNDLISIAQAERGHLASEGNYATFDELISGKYLTIRSERPPYSYSVEVSSGGFKATATRTTAGSPAELWITDDMQVQSSE